MGASYHRGMPPVIGLRRSRSTASIGRECGHHLAERGEQAREMLHAMGLPMTRDPGLAAIDDRAEALGDSDWARRG